MNKQRLVESTQVLTNLIKLTASLYQSGKLSTSQQAFLETLVGAGIWYLPSDKKVLFNGKISRAALEKLKADPKTNLVEEHFIPRKVAGHALYTRYLNQIIHDENLLQELYLTEFGRFNYVLKTENSKLAKFQRVNTFIDEETAYLNAGIEMVSITLEEIEQYKKSNKKAA